MFNLLIRNARIAHPDGSLFEADVACEDGRIARLDSNISAPTLETIDAAGELLLPGVIDPQVHFREDLATGSRAAWPQYTSVNDDAALYNGKIRETTHGRPLTYLA